jgi:FkbM family methyltransferase
VRAAVWAHRGAVAIDGEHGDNRSFRCVPRAEAEGGIPAVTVGELLAGSGLNAIDILKMDIEGAEREIFLSGDQGWLASTRALLIEIHERDFPGSRAAIHSALEGRTERMWTRGEIDGFCLKTNE